MGRRGRGSLTPLETYRKWNEQLNQYFLREENSGRPLYLDPDAEMYEHLEQRFGLDRGTGRDRLLDVVRGALEPPEFRSNLFVHLETDLLRWRKDAGERRGATELAEMAFPPPVIALLTTTVIAAQEMDESATGAKYVSSTNYYEHLLPVLRLGSGDKQKLRRDFTVTETFWESFSWWLDEMDGRYGLPSARATSGQRYVGLPVSQALVRAADRRALRRMFHQFGFAPRSSVSPAEMGEVVAEWVHSPGSGASKELTGKWSAAEARRRIVDVAISELEGWDGSVESVEREAPGTPRGLHRERVMLGILVRGRAEDQEISDLGFVVRRDPDPGTWSVRHSGGQEPVHPRPVSTSTSFVAGYELGVRPSELLDKEIALTHEDGRELVRSPRRIVVLVEDEAAGTYVEVRRAVSGARHRILVSPETPDELVDRLRDLLRRTAFSGRRDVEVHGLPADWLVVDGFVPGSVPEGYQVEDELSPLVASVSTQFHVRGGIRIPGRVRRWHSDAVPEVVVTLGAEGGTYDLRLTELRTGGAPVTLRAGITTPEVIALPDEVGDGDYRIELRASAGGDLVQSETLRLRSGRTRSVEGWRLRPCLGHDEEPLDATAARTLPEAALVRGALVDGEGRSRPVSGPPPAVDWSSRHVRRSTETRTLLLPDPSTRSCLVTGHHRFHFPTFLDGQKRPTWQTGVCTECGAVRRSPTSHWMALKPEERAARLRARGRAVPASAAEEPVDVAALPVVELPEIEADDIPPVVVEDAIAHLHSGDVAMLLALSSQAPDLTEDHPQLLRDLSALGTVEASRDAFFRRDRWEAREASVSVLADGRPALTGAWDLESLDGAEAAAEELGGSVRLATTGRHLSVVDGVGAEAFLAHEALAGVTDAGRSYARLAGILPDLSEVARDLPRRDVTMVDGPWQMYRVDELAWIDVAGWEAPGLYRRHRGYRREYWYRGADDIGARTAAPVDVDLGKHLAALDLRNPLLAYESRSKELTVPLGARLPELYERTAVLCAGRVPTPDRSAFSLTYHGVPEDIAATLHARITS